MRRTPRTPGRGAVSVVWSSRVLRRDEHLHLGDGARGGDDLVSTGSAFGASVRSVHSPSPAKNRKCPVAEVGTSAVNSPVRSSRRT